MADKKISELNSGDPAQTNDQIPINRAGTNFRITAGSISSLATANSANTEVLFNDSGIVNGESVFTFSKATGSFSVPFITATPQIDAPAGTFRRNSGSQTSNILNIQTEANAPLAAFDKDGNLSAPRLDIDNIRVDGSAITSTNTNGNIDITPNGTGRAVLTNLTTTSPRIITGINDTNGNELFLFTATGSAVNEFTVTNGATGTGPTLSATGGDTNVNIRIAPKGSGVVQELVGSTYYNIVSQTDVGTGPNQIPLNQYLGGLAYKNTELQALDVGTGITTGTGTICKAHGGLQDGVYVVRVLIDLTGLNSGGTANDIIGVNGTALPCYIARLPAMTVLGGRMTCLEAPAGGDTDIDLYSATEGTGVEDAAVTGLTETLIINAGTQSLGTTTYFAADPGPNHYLYLAGQSTSNATYTAGRFLIEIFGVQ